MTSEEARWHVVSAFRTLGMATYEGRVRPTSLPDVVVMDPDTGAIATVRVAVGARPRAGARLYFDRRRAGRFADAVAVVDPSSGAVEVRPSAERTWRREVPVKVFPTADAPPPASDDRKRALRAGPA